MIEKPAAGCAWRPGDEPTWLPGAIRIEKTTDGPVGQGTGFEGEYARAGTVSLDLVEFERPYRVTFRARSRIVQFDDAVTLLSAGMGTRLRATMEAYPQGFMKLMAPVMGRIMRRQFEGNWSALRDALEAKGSGVGA